MRTTLLTLLVTSSASLSIGTPAHAGAPTCASAYCATLPDPAQRMELLSYLADQKGAKVSVSPILCRALSGSPRRGCAVLQAVLADTRRATAYTRLAKSWTDDSRAAFSRLLGAEEAFAEAVGENEVDHTSTEAGADAITAQQAEKEAFWTTLRKVVAGTARFSNVEFAHVEFAHVEFLSTDSALNAAYQQVMAVPNPSDLAWGSVEKDGIKRTQRAWLVYRDAFVGFVTTRDAGAAESVKAELTTRRAVSLEGFLED